MTKTLLEKGTPWAEQYQGSGRLTGRLAEEPTYCQNGDVAPGWTNVGDVTEDEFHAEFEDGQHDQCHTRSTADYSCIHCQEAGWV